MSSVAEDHDIRLCKIKLHDRLAHAHPAQVGRGLGNHGRGISIGLKTDEEVIEGGGIEVIPSTHAVNFCYRGMKGPPAKDNDAAAVKIACSLADDFLHELVREQGGAYAGPV